jgi:hypothetical protein
MEVFFMNGFFKKILLFFLVFQILCGIIIAQSAPDSLPPLAPKEVQVDMLIDFSGMIDVLWEIFTSFLAEYYGLLIGIFVAYLFMGYIQGIAEGYNERIRQKRILLQSEQKSAVKRRENERERDRKFLSRYLGDSSSVDRVLHDIEGDNWKDAVTLHRKEVELCVAPSDPGDLPIDDVSVIDYEFYVDKDDNVVKRASQEYGTRFTTYWTKEGYEEGSESIKYCKNFHSDDDEGDYYPRLARIEDDDDEDGY